MTQFARPDSDVATTGWSSTPLWSKIDESSASDADAITGIFTSNTLATAEVGLSNVSDPLQNTGHKISVRARTNNPSLEETFFCDIVQGTTVKATLIAVLSGSYITYTYTLSGTEADSISNYSDLRLRFRATTIAADPIGLSINVSWAQFETPDPVTPVSSSLISVYEALKFVSQSA